MKLPLLPPTSLDLDVKAELPKVELPKLGLPKAELPRVHLQLPLG